MNANFWPLLIKYMFYKFIIKIRHVLTKIFFLASTFKAIIYAISCEFDLLMFCIFLSDEFFKKSMVKIISTKSITDLQNEIPNIKVHLCRGWAIKRSWKRYFSRSLHLKKNQNWNSMGHFHMIIVLTTVPWLGPLAST